MTSPETELQLVTRLSNPADHEAWQSFLASYTPFLVAFFRHRNLQEADAYDLTQKVLLAVARRVVDWVPDGRPEAFRRWLRTIARHEAIKFWIKAERNQPSPGGTDFLQRLHEQPADRSFEEQSAAAEYRQAALQWALPLVRQEVRPATWEIFWRTCLLHEPIDHVARELNISAGAIYMARSRVMSKLRERVLQYDPDDHEPMG